MPTQTIEIPGVGPVEFPDSMSDEQVTAAAKKLHDDLVSQNETPTDVFHKSFGENVSGALSGAYDRGKDILKSIPLMFMDPLGTETAKVTGRGETDPLNAAGNMALNTVKEPYRIGQEAGEGTPEALGKATVDTAALVPAILGMKGAAERIGTPVVKGAPRVIGAVARNTPPEAVQLGGAALGAYTGGPAGAMEGYLGGGLLARIMKKASKLGLPEEPEVAPSMSKDTLKAMNADEAAKALRDATDVQVSSTHPDLDAYGRGRAGGPPVEESLRSQGESLLSPEAQAHAASLNVTPANNLVSTSARDMLTPQAQAMMDAMHKEANPVFRRMQAEGQFSGDRTTGPAPEGAEASTDTTAVDAIRAIMGGDGPSTLDIGRTRGGGPIASHAPTGPLSIVDRYMANTSGDVVPTTPAPATSRVPYAMPDAPGAPSPNAGGRLIKNPAPRMSAPAMAAAPAPVEGVSLPEQGTGPSVTMSPKAKGVANRPPAALESLEDAMRQREQGAAANRYEPDVQVVQGGETGQTMPSAADVTDSMIQRMMKGNGKPVASHDAPVVEATPKPRKVAPTGSSIEQQFKTLSKKNILTPEEATTLARLKTIMKGRASNIGLNYAAGGK